MAATIKIIRENSNDFSGTLYLNIAPSRFVCLRYGRVGASLLPNEASEQICLALCEVFSGFGCLRFDRVGASRLPDAATAQVRLA